MLRLLCLSICLVAAYSSATKGTCQVGDWGEWSACQPAIDCTTSTQASWPTKEMDPELATIRRELNMKRKLMANARAAACRSSGSCGMLQGNLPNESIWEAQECIDGITEAGYLCNNVDLLAKISMDDLGYADPIAPDNYEGRTGSDIWGWRDEDYGHDYVVVGLSGGSSFVNVTIPERPVVLAFLPTHSSASNWRDMKVMGHWAYIVSEARDHGIQAFDMHQLRDMENGWNGRLDESYYQHYDGIGQSHNIIVNEATGYLYVVGAYYNAGSEPLCGGGLHIVKVDTSDGGHTMTFESCVGEDGYVHDGECVIYHGPDTRYTGNEICFGYNENSFTIYDVTNKNNPQVISRSTYASQYTHQGWVTEDHTTVLLDDELDERDTSDKLTKTYVWDVRDLNAPVLEKTCRSHMESIDHNQYIVKDLTYQSNYQAGLRIQEINSVDFDLTEVAHFQTTIGDTEAEFGYGTWSNYPYFIAEGENYPRAISASCKEHGLFILRPDYDAIFSSTRKTGVQKRARDVVVEGSNCPLLSETRTCYEM